MVHPGAEASVDDQSRARHKARDSTIDRRREALTAALRDHDLTVSELARRADLPNPNGIYNFLHGRSNDLSMSTLRKIYPHLPKCDVFKLFANSSNSGALTAKPISKKKVSDAASQVAAQITQLEQKFVEINTSFESSKTAIAQCIDIIKVLQIELNRGRAM